MKDEFSCRVYGCLFGAIIGDALGAFCEFHNTNLPNELLEESTISPIKPWR
jgi:ADP-ribosylglycohydrolase